MYDRARFKFSGKVHAELEAPDGSVRTVDVHNAVSDYMAAAAASALAQQSAGIPAIIRLGTGALASVDADGVDNHTVLDDPLAQFFTQDQASSISIGYVLLGLKRVGTSAGTLSVKVFTPTGTVALDESDTVPVNGLSSTGFNWVRFEFANPIALAPGVYRLELSSSGYTYSAGVTEVQWAYDSDNPYTVGYMSYWNGTSWQSVAGNGDIDAMFRIVLKTHDQMTALVGSIASTQIDGYSKSGRYLARFLSIFGVMATDIYVGHVALEDSDGNLLAIATTNIDKSMAEVLRIYWTIEVTP